MARRSKDPTRVAIVGGGCAAMAAAFDLTRPEQEGRYEVTVYQQGWRLGGKGASGRGIAGRIEEHGLHIWMGWYENAFRQMRECYTELTGDPDAWQQAFAPAPLLSVTDRTPDGGWLPWTRVFPPAAGLPGDPIPGLRWTVRDYMLRTVSLLRALFEGVRIRVLDDAPRSTRARNTSEAALGALDRLFDYGELATLAGITQAVATLETMLASRLDAAQTPGVGFLETLMTNSRRLLATALERDAELRRAWHVIDLSFATLRGYVTSGVLTDPRGFDAIDHLDCREWLRLNGASEEALDSGYLRGLYDLGFSYEDGDYTKPRVSAGQAVRGFVRAFFTYRGAFFWKMQGGMGDVIFAPLYEVLRRRGVRFRFFHRLRNVRVGRGRPPHVGALEFDVQARPARGDYEPLVDVKGMRCWPSQPLLDQLEDGRRLRREGWDFESHWDRRHVGTTTVRVGKDFDFVVLGVGIAAIPHVGAELLAANPRWRDMVAHVKTVPSQAFQIWLDAELPELGWTAGSVTLSGFAEPFDTWADMPHLIAREAWPTPPRGLAYFCNVMPDLPGGPEEQRARVRQNAIDFLNRDLGHLWPGAVRAPGEFAWDLLAVPPNGRRPAPRGEARFDAQWWTANVNPSDRYTLCLPGTARYRVSPLDTDFDNLTICGDWTDTGFHSACVEAATMSGRLASHALSRLPALEDIVGYDHP
jgi:uncharacterized protein with NAD-binding domain and iron-sulfur cluster